MVSGGFKGLLGVSGVFHGVPSDLSIRDIPGSLWEFNMRSKSVSFNCIPGISWPFQEILTAFQVLQEPS